MSNSTGPLVGLGDKDFDSSIYSQEVDFDFFEESSPSTVTPPHQPLSTTTIHEAEPRRESPKPMEPPPAIFSTDSLLASLSCLNEINSDDDDDHGGIDNNETNNKEMSNGHHRTRLFDISDTSSDEDEESQPHMIANLNSILLQQHNACDDSIDEDNYLTDDSNLSDITDVTPISSLACSPMPSPCAGDLHQNDDEDQSIWIDYEGDQEPPEAPHLRLELRSCGQQLGPLHLDVLEIGTPTLSSSFLLMETAIAATSMNDNVNGHSMIMPPTKWQCQQLSEFTGSNDSLMNCRNTNIVGCSVSDVIPVSLSSSSSETGSGSVCCGSSSSMSIPSESTTTMSISGSSSTTKVFGHTRHSSCKTRCKNHSFTKDETRRIERDNQILLKKIMDTQKRKHHHSGSTSASGGHIKIKQHPALNARNKQQKRIDYENSILVQKLQNVKPSKEIRVAFPEVSPSTTRSSSHGPGH